ncbi:MAG: DUF3329 domain-containing protein [Alphaproteobacteria bacterium]|nr:DUF3329 domain-containing protein [Alphaproteobacteria bacterium]
MSRFLDLQVPFFIPLWRRIAVVAVSGGWGIFEFATGAPFFGVLFCAVALWAAYSFFIIFDPKEPK